MSATLWPILLLALAPIWLSVLLGPSVVTGNAGDDANFALHLVRLLYNGISHGHFWPRWSAIGNEGYGSPALYFYSPLAYWVAGLTGSALKLPLALALSLSIGIFRTVAFVTCWLWLRLHTDNKVAAWGALLFVSLPALGLLNPTIRVAMGETAATAFLPLLFYVCDGIKGERWFVIAFSVVTALLVFTHLPQTLLGLLCVGAYLLAGKRWRKALLAIAGACLGFALAGAFVIPALGLQSAITASGWDSPWLDPRNNMLFSRASIDLHRYRVSSLVCLYATFAICLLIGLIAAAAKRSVTKPATAPSFLLLGVLLGMTPVATIFWTNLAVLHRLQFPWRLMPLAGLFSSLCAVLLAQHSKHYRLALAGFASALGAGLLFLLMLCGAASWPGLLPVSLARAVKGRLPNYVSYSERETQQQSGRGSDVPEYVPTLATAAGWDFHVPGVNPPVLAEEGRFGRRPSALASQHQTRADTGSDGAVFTLHENDSAERTFLLHQFYFPGWTASPLAPGVLLQGDKETGLVRAYLPAGHASVIVRRTTPKLERAGWIFSGTGLVGLILLPIWVSLSRRDVGSVPNDLMPSDLRDRSHYL